MPDDPGQRSWDTLQQKCRAAWKSPRTGHKGPLQANFMLRSFVSHVKLGVLLPPQEARGNACRQVWTGGGAVLAGREVLTTLQSIAQPPHQELSHPQMSTAPGLRAPAPSHSSASRTRTPSFQVTGCQRGLRGHRTTSRGFCDCRYLGRG